MNIKSERGQAQYVLILILLGVVAIAFLVLTGGAPGMKQGADTIGNAAGSAIETVAVDQEFENLVWSAQNAVSAWVGPQRNIVPNKHAVERHGADAWKVTDCYNRNGAFHVIRTTFDGIHLLCKDNDGSIRDMILKQRQKPNEFDFDNAFTPQDGTLREVLAWINRKFGAGKFAMPENSIIYVDGIAP